jgi:hypothetical protein
MNTSPRRMLPNTDISKARGQALGFGPRKLTTKDQDTMACGRLADHAFNEHYDEWTTLETIT